MKALRSFTATLLMLVAMAASAENIKTVIGSLKYELDTEAKVATVIQGDYQNRTYIVIPNTVEYGGGNIL